MDNTENLDEMQRLMAENETLKTELFMFRLDNLLLSNFKSAMDKHVILAITNINGVILYANSKFCEISQYSQEELVGQTHRIINSHYHPKVFFQEIWNTIKSNKVWNGEICNQAKDGSLYWVATTIVPFVDENNNIFQFIAIRSDITKRKEIERMILQDQKIMELQNTELKELNATKDKFFSIIAHDLRSPLSGFLALTQVISEHAQEMSLEKIQSLSKTMNSSANSLYKLLETLLEWSKIQRGQVTFRPVVCILSILVDQNIVLLKGLAQQKNITILNQISNKVEVVADTFMLNTIIRNILTNGIKFTKEGGHIIVTAIEEKEKFILSIKDSGIGMDATKISKLFQIGTTVSEKGTHGEKGTGLGLILCKEMIALHNEEIWLESELNIGTTFYISLPKIPSQK